MFQQMAQPVVTKIERLDDLRGQAAQSVVHTLEIGFYRHLPMVAFREDIRQPDHGRPPPTASALPPMAGERPVQDSGKPIVTICPMSSATSSTRSVIITT